MPRTRQLKHDFFLNEDLAALSPMARLLFAGLWLLADREGRLEDRPAKIKAQLFPYHEADVSSLISELSGFVRRYEAKGERYIEVKNFKKHQHIHPDEKASVLPAFKTSSEIPGDFKTRSEIMPISPLSVVCSPMSSSPSPSPSAVQAPQTEPKRTAVQIVVEAYKMAKVVEKKDKAWDRNNFPRASKAAKSLLERFQGSAASAVAYIIAEGDRMDSIPRDWTLETISKHAWDNLGVLQSTPEASDAIQRRDGKVVEAMGANRLLGGRGPGGLAPAREAMPSELRSPVSGEPRYEDDGGDAD